MSARIHSDEFCNNLNKYKRQSQSQPAARARGEVMIYLFYSCRRPDSLWQKPSRQNRITHSSLIKSAGKLGAAISENPWYVLCVRCKPVNVMTIYKGFLKGDC